MKKLCSGLLVFSMALSPVGTSGCALEKNANFTPMVSQEKTSWLRENSQKNNTKTSDMEIDSKINEILNKEQAKNKKKSPRVTNVNVDLKVPAIVASVAAVAAVAFSKYSDIQVAQIQKEIKEIESNNNVFKKFYSATGESISSVWNLAKENMPAAVDWTKDKTTALWSFGKENLPAAIEWSKDEYDSLNSWLINSGCEDSTAKGISIATAVGMSLLACFGGYKLATGVLKSIFNLPISALTSTACFVGKAVGAPVYGLVKGVKLYF